ncbi:MAG: HAMP domain-containing histidine kinase [Chloroflexi bacterium]|nr:HAMP domain-containing histidine kinase [Chloroflexota bacterium]
MRQRLSRFSLATRLTTWYVGLLFLLLLVLGTVLYIGAMRLSSATALGEASIEGHNLQGALTQALSRGEPLGAAAASAISSRRMQDNLVIVADVDGSVVATSTGSAAPLLGTGNAGTDVLRGSADEWLGVINGDTSDPLAVSLVRISDPRSGATRGTILVGTSLAESQRVAQNMLLVVLAGFAAILLVATVIGPRLTRIGLRPLRTMAEASRHLAGGDLSVRVATSDVGDEVGELGRAFNEMAAKLQASFAVQQTFVADASHELRTPLTALGGQIDVLVHVLDTRPEEARRLAGFMRRELDRMSALVDDLLVLARVDAQGAAALRMRPVDLRSVARDVYEQARVLPSACGREISLAVDPMAVAVCGDPRRLHQVVLNLATNALQHAPEAGHVAIRVWRADRLAHVQVRDDGPGISEDHLSQVFERFYRTDSARTRVEGGSGLGLAIARAIVEAHGGSIVVSSTEGVGATFSVTLPSAS